MEYQKVTEAEVLPGVVLNFGGGDVEIVVKVEESTKFGFGANLPQVVKEVTLSKIDGRLDTYFLSAVCRSATRLTVDPNIKRCRYCGALRDPSDFKRATIRVNRRDETDDYCADRPCAGNAQMAAEG